MKKSYKNSTFFVYYKCIKLFILAGSIIAMKEEMQKKKECELETNDTNSDENDDNNKDDDTHLNDISVNKSGMYKCKLTVFLSLFINYYYTF